LDRALSVSFTQPSTTEEAQKLHTLRHNHITYFYDFFEYQNAFYIVSERCGLTLESFLSPTYHGDCLVKPIARCVFQALQYLHDHGYVHQDIHLNNVFIHWWKSELVRNETVISFKVGDLGLAKRVEKMDPKNTLLADWMIPPEALRPEEFGKLDHRMDLYHAALVLLQVMIGQRLILTHDEILAGTPRIIAEGQGAVGQVLSRGLRRHVDARPSSAVEFWEALDRATP
jgi:serine/threonine protein kinase